MSSRGHDTPLQSENRAVCTGWGAEEGVPKPPGDISNK